MTVQRNNKRVGSVEIAVVVITVVRAQNFTMLPLKYEWAKLKK